MAGEGDAVCKGEDDGCHTVVVAEISLCVMKLLEEMMTEGVLPDAQTFFGLMEYFGRKGDLKTMHKLFGMTEMDMWCGVGEWLKMLDDYLDFFMKSSLTDCYSNLNEELDKLLEKKLRDPSLDIHKTGKYLMLAVQELISSDLCEGRFVFGQETKRSRFTSNLEIESSIIKDGMNPKSLLQTWLMQACYSPPKYKTKHPKTNEFRAIVEFKGMQFVVIVYEALCRVLFGS